MLNIQHIRNATMIIETTNDVILVDPMLGPQGTMPPLAFIRQKMRKNPTVPFPKAGEKLLKRVTHCLITHRHPDHLDAEGFRFLKDHSTPVTCSVKDEKTLRKKGLNVVQALKYWEKTSFLQGSIVGVPALHGYGFIAKPMSPVMGFFLSLHGLPSIYISSDTIYTNDVDRVLNEHKPDIAIVASGSAQFDLFQPLLMTIEDVLKFIKNAPGKVIANHMEAVNHCPTTRSQLREAAKKEGLLEKLYVPEDGEVMGF